MSSLLAVGSVKAVTWDAAGLDGLLLECPSTGHATNALTRWPGVADPRSGGPTLTSDACSSGDGTITPEAGRGANVGESMQELSSVSILRSTAAADLPPFSTTNAVCVHADVSRARLGIE